MTEHNAENLRRYVVLSVISYADELSKLEKRIKKLEKCMDKLPTCKLCYRQFGHSGFNNYHGICVLCKRSMCYSCSRDPPDGIRGFVCKKCIKKRKRAWEN